MKHTALEAIISPVVVGMGYELWGIEYFPQGKHSRLCVYIDKSDGIKLEDCTAVSRQVGAVLEVEEPIRGHYALEVSSPGTDRPLLKLAHYQRYIGQQVQVRLRVAQDGQRKFKGELISADEQSIILAVEGERITFTMQNIDKSHLIEDLFVRQQR